MCVCVCVCSLWGVFQGHREARTVFAIEMQGVAQEARQVNGPPTWLSRLPKGTPNEFRVVEREERSGDDSQPFIYKKKKKYTASPLVLAHATEPSGRMEERKEFGQQHGGKQG